MARTYSSLEVLEASQGVRERSIALLRSAGEEQAASMVPTCPIWTAKELACHMYGVCDDLLTGRLEGIGSDDWTQAQVERHGSKPLNELLDEWAASAEAFDAIVPQLPEPANYQLVMDLATHEHDLRLALASPGAHEDLSLAIGAEYMLISIRGTDAEFAEQIEGLGLSDFELLRALTGRRSIAQLEAMDISAERLARILDPSPMTIVAVDLVEGAG
jgi:hypothetical protein